MFYTKMAHSTLISEDWQESDCSVANCKDYCIIVFTNLRLWLPFATG